MSKPVITFLGADFASLSEFQRQYPKFATDDTLAAVKAGCDTPLKVEIAVAAKREAARRRSREAARNGQFGARFAFGDG